MMVDEFPNYLMIFGPSSVLLVPEVPPRSSRMSVNYCVKVLRKTHKEDYARWSPSRRVRDSKQIIGVYFSNPVLSGQVQVLVPE